MARRAQPQRITGLGAALVDMTARVSDAQLAQLGSAKGMMELIDPARAQHLLAQVTLASQSAGGSVANTIAGLAALDVPTGFISAIGSDARGQFFRRALEELGTACALTVSPQQPTGCSLILLTPDSERSMHTLLGAAGAIPPAALDSALLAQTRLLFGEAYLWDSADNRARFVAAAAQVRQGGGEVALALADPLCVARHRSALRGFAAEHVDILIGNEKEACAFYQTAELAGALAVAEAERCTGAFTRSAQGAVVLEAGASLHLPAQWVANIQDLTGAGDMFAAGYLAARRAAAAPAQCGALGIACASEILTQLGARPRTDLRALRNRILS